MNLQGHIYSLYYEGAKRDGVIWTIGDFAERKNLKFEEDDPYTNSVIKEHGQAIEDVLTLEISIYVFRRLPGAWGEVIDSLAKQRSNKIIEHRTKTGYSIDTENSYI